MKLDLSKMPLTSEAFTKEFTSTTDEDKLEVDYPEDKHTGKGVAELLVDPVFQGWRRAMRITGYLQGWRTRYCHKGHLIPDEDCRVCKLGDHRWDPRNETKKAEDYFFGWESNRVCEKLKPAELKKFRIQDGIVLDNGRLSPDFQLKTQDLDGVGYLDKHEIGSEIPVVLSDSPLSKKCIRR